MTKLKTQPTFHSRWSTAEHLIEDMETAFISSLAHSTWLLQQIWFSIVLRKILFWNFHFSKYHL